MPKGKDKANRYAVILLAIFKSKYKRGITKIDFERPDIEKFSRKLKIGLPKNLGDVIYSFRYRVPLPDYIRSKAPRGKMWVIRSAGRAKYRFELTKHIAIKPAKNMATTKVPDATPGIVEKYALGDEQGLLARLRYNRLIDVFTGITCYSLQNHLRTTVPELGQVETDEIYVGLDKKGVHYVFPVQAKGGKDKLNVVQIEQDFAVCEKHFQKLICRPIGAQFLPGGVIALFEFELNSKGVQVSGEKHYKLVPYDDVTESDLSAYRSRVVD